MNSDPNCIFCKIVAGQEQASKVYEDEHLLGFLNNRPVHEGECLIIPKEHIDHFMDIDDELVSRIMKLAQKLARRIRDVIGPQRVGYVVAGYGVPHAHLIVIPQYHTNDITCEHFAVQRDGKIIFTDQHIPLADRSALEATAKKIPVTL